MERNLTEGNVFKHLMLFSLPYLLSFFLQTLYGMADLLIIGQFEGVASSTAVSVGSQVMHFATVVIVGLAMGSTVVIAQAVGADDRRKVSVTVGNAVTLFVGFSVVLAAVLLLLCDNIVAAMSTPASAVAGTKQYLIICFIGIPFITAYNVISSIFRGMGDSKSPMCFIAIACVANILLDLLFMGVFRLGPAGAALGTTLSQAISVLISLLVIVKRKTILLHRSDLRLKRSVMGQVLKIGVPIAAQDGLIQVGFLIITIIANLRGLNDAAAVGIVEKIIGFLFLVPSSMLSAVSALAAQNIGAGKPERAKQTLRYAIITTVSFGVIVAFATQFCAEKLVSLFTDTSAADGAEVVRMGGQYLRGYVIDCIFAGIHFCFSGYFTALGKSLIPFAHNILSLTLVRVPGVYLASRLFPATLFPMGLATVFGSVFSVLICVVVYHVLRKKATALPAT